MNYEQFVCAMLACAERKVSASEIVEKQEILKNNGVIAVGISIRNLTTNVAPVVYLEDYFKRYESGETIEALTEHLLKRSRSAPPAPAWDYEEILDFRKIRHKIVYKLVDAQRNERLLKEVPNLPVLDFAIIFYIIIPVNETENCSVLIRNAHMNLWKLPISVLYQCAKENTPKLCPPRFCTLSDMVEEYFGEAVPDCPLYVLTNETGVNGASVLLYPHMPKLIYEYLRGNYYLLPASIHEFLVVQEDAELSPEHLKAIVREVNETQIEKEELLSDHVYYFDGNIITKM